jgi:hypothetical protein
MAALLAAAALPVVFGCASSDKTVVREPEEREPQMVPASGNRPKTETPRREQREEDQDIRVDVHKGNQ